MTPEQIETQARTVMAWYDALPKQEREFVNEYGVRAWNQYYRSGYYPTGLRTFETFYRQFMKLPEIKRHAL